MALCFSCLTVIPCSSAGTGGVKGFVHGRPGAARGLSLSSAGSCVSAASWPSAGRMVSVERLHCDGMLARLTQHKPSITSNLYYFICREHAVWQSDAVTRLFSQPVSQAVSVGKLCFCSQYLLHLLCACLVSAIFLMVVLLRSKGCRVVSVGAFLSEWVCSWQVDLYIVSSNSSCAG